MDFEFQSPLQMQRSALLRFPISWGPYFDCNSDVLRRQARIRRFNSVQTCRRKAPPPPDSRTPAAQPKASGLRRFLKIPDVALEREIFRSSPDEAPFLRVRQRVLRSRRRSI